MTLQLDRLAVSIGDRELMPPTDLEVADGQLLAVVGASGSGKTTVLAVLAGLNDPASGRALVDGCPAAEFDRSAMGVVTQPVVLSATLTVEENISLPMLAAGQPAEEIDRIWPELLHQLHLERLADRTPGQLSGGQRQRVAVARAVIGRPRLVVADEPTSELDESSRDRVVDVLRLAAGQGAAVVVATHDPEIAQACDLTLVLDD